MAADFEELPADEQRDMLQRDMLQPGCWNISRRPKLREYCRRICYLVASLAPARPQWQ